MLLLLVLSAANAVILHAAPSLHFAFKRMNGVVDVLPRRLDEAQFVEPPKIHISSKPVPVTVAEGETAEFLCEASGIPPSSISWTHEGKTLEGSATVSEERGLERLLNLGLETVEFGVQRSRLRVPCAGPAHAGTYTCLATNGLHTVKASAKLSLTPPGNRLAVCNEKSVTAAPYIYFWSDSRLERQGASATLSCRASGSPAPAMDWMDSEGNSVVDGAEFQLLPNGDLFITQADWSHMDTYTCVARNEHGEDSQDIFFYPTALEEGMSTRPEPADS